MEVKMYHVNDLIVSSRYKERQAEIRHDYDQKDLASFSTKSSTGLTGRTIDSLGDGLIRIGQKLKEGDSSKPSPIYPTLDFD
jgi:hypothetical protein